MRQSGVISHARKRGFVRFAKYTGIGMSTFALDLVLLIICTDVFGIPPVLSAGMCFLLAISLHYVFSRRHVFHGTVRPVRSGYVIFLCIAFGGLALVTGLMHLLVNILGMHYIPSRILVAAFVGMWNYLMNLHVNFKVAGR